MWLEDNEMEIANIWMLSLENNGFGAISINYNFVKDFSTKEKIDHVDLYRIFRIMAMEIKKE